MASDDTIVQEWLDHLKGMNVETKKMFGCYCLYCDGQAVGWIHDSVLSLREVGLGYLPDDIRRPDKGDRIQELVIPFDYAGAGWLPKAVQDTADIRKREMNREMQESKMENCEWCGLSEADRRFQVYESVFWAVFLSDEQDYIGRCVLVLKRHCGSLSELTEEEWEELRGLICKVEDCLKTVLGAALCNWSCLMNSFYKESVPDPHLHIHVRPRYDRPVTINGSSYIDGEFGHHYAVKKGGEISDKDREDVFTRLKKRLNC